MADPLAVELACRLRALRAGNHGKNCDRDERSCRMTDHGDLAILLVVVASCHYNDFGRCDGRHKMVDSPPAGATRRRALPLHLSRRSRSGSSSQHQPRDAFASFVSERLDALFVASSPFFSAGVSNWPTWLPAMRDTRGLSVS